MKTILTPDAFSPSSRVHEAQVEWAATGRLSQMTLLTLADVVADAKVTLAQVGLLLSLAGGGR